MDEPLISKPPSATAFILSVNGGSSSVKFGVFTNEALPTLRLKGRIDRIGDLGATLVAEEPGGERATHRVEASDRSSAVASLAAFLSSRLEGEAPSGVGHRIVHGGPRHLDTEAITPELLDDLREIVPYDPEHLPFELELIEEFTRVYPDAPRFACFDTAFHRDLPEVATRLPIPRRYGASGLRRYGFHGLSCASLMSSLREAAGEAAARGRVILAHLGNGASMTAVLSGKSLDTSMSFTPTAGLVMGTRSGDLDPGLFRYFANAEGMTPDRFHRMVSSESGLLGISETGSDVRDLLAARATDFRAQEAIAIFCRQAKKWIGAFSAVLGGLNTLVFSGGIGENSPEIREEICSGMDYLGITLSSVRNMSNAPVISGEGAAVTVRVIASDEEAVIAREVRGGLQAATTARPGADS